MFGTSDAWSMIHLSQQTSVLYCRLLYFNSSDSTFLACLDLPSKKLMLIWLLPHLYSFKKLGQYSFSFPVTKALVMLQKPRKKLNHNLIVNFAVMLESMKWNAMMKRKKQNYLWTNALTKIVGSKISNMNIMPEKGQKRAKLTTKDTKGMWKSILFLDKMSPKVNHQK